MATMTTDESTRSTACQGKIGDAEDALYTAKNKLDDAIDEMTALMAYEKAITPQTDATRLNFNEAFRARSKLKERHADVMTAIARLESTHSELSAMGMALWSNFGVSYIYGGRPR